MFKWFEWIYLFLCIAFCIYAFIDKEYFLGIVFTIITVAVPSSNTVQEMAVASVVTYENVEAVNGEVTELIDYIIDSVDKLNDSKECE